MKLILEYKDNRVTLTSDDDKVNSYVLLWRDDDNMCSIWYNDQFWIERECDSLSHAVANFVASVFQGMLDQEVK